MPVQKTEAVVLSYHPLGEADRIVAFYTEGFGKIRAVARGVRRVKSRLCGRLEILTYGNLVFFERTDKDLHVVNSFGIIQPFQTLREDIVKMGYCFYLAELIQQVEFSEAFNEGVFKLIIDIMSMMETTDDPEMLAHTFELRLLASAGLSPHLDSCVLCSGDVGSDATVGFSVADGGVICGECRNTGITAKAPVIFISRGTVELMRRMQQAPLEFIPRLRILEVSRHELRRIFRSFISFHVDSRRFRSLEFLESIESEVV